MAYEIAVEISDIDALAGVIEQLTGFSATARAGSLYQQAAVAGHPAAARALQMFADAWEPGLAYLDNDLATLAAQLRSAGCQYSETETNIARAESQ